MSPETFPLVSLGIPLYRSAPFFDIIKNNLQAVDYPNVEIFVSDRHCYDDTIERLREYFADDPRIKIFVETDQLDWVGHFNFLLKQGRGKYFRWMPHDDNFPTCDLKKMVGYLESHPKSILTWGPTQLLSTDGHLKEMQGQPAPSANPDWTLDISVLFNFHNYCNGAFKGLFRREVVEQHDLYISRTYHLQYSERCWLFAMSLLGDFYFREDYHYEKRIYRGSTHEQWKTSIPNILSQCWVMQKYLWRSPNTLRNKLVGSFFITVLTSLKISIAISGLIRRTNSISRINRLPANLEDRISKLILIAASKPKDAREVS